MANVDLFLSFCIPRADNDVFFFQHKETTWSISPHFPFLSWLKKGGWNGLFSGPQRVWWPHSEDRKKKIGPSHTAANPSWSDEKQKETWIFFVQWFHRMPMTRKKQEIASSVFSLWGGQRSLPVTLRIFQPIFVTYKKNARDTNYSTGFSNNLKISMG